MLRETCVKNGRLRGIPCGDPRVTVYKGVPYALPPVGALRWKAPQPMHDWDGVRDADRFAAMSCQNQPGLDWSEFYTKELHPTAYEYPMSEDCLYLNVWTPAVDSSERLPVFFYIHGGGFTAGYSYEMEFDGERVARKGCVMVTAGYRLGAMGFFAHEDLTREDPSASQGNFGFLDQLAALRWVKQNIAAFGGDPDRITIAGQSAGASSVTALVCSPMLQNLIQGAVFMSGGGMRRGASMARTLDEAQQEGSDLLRTLNVTTVEEARRLPAEAIIASFHGMRSRKGMRPPALCIDGVFLKENPMDVMLANKLPDIPYLLGYCYDEGFNFFRPMEKLPETVEAFEAQVRAEYGSHADRYLELAGVKSAADIEALHSSADFHPFLLSHGCLAKVLAEQKRPVYMYLFDHDVPGDDGAGSYHGSDLWFVFDSLNRNWRPFVGKHYDLARQVCTYFVNFTRHGHPNGADHDGSPLPCWDPYTQEKPVIMRFGDSPEQFCQEEPSELLTLRQDSFLNRLKG